MAESIMLPCELLGAAKGARKRSGTSDPSMAFHVSFERVWSFEPTHAIREIACEWFLGNVFLHHS